MYGTIDVTVCVLDSINHRMTAKRIYCVASASVSLFCDPEGLFVFDINTVRKRREVLADNTFVYDMESVYCVWQNYLDSDSKDSRVDIALDIFSLKTRTALVSVPVRIFQRLLYRLKKLKNYCIRQASEFLTDIII